MLLLAVAGAADLVSAVLRQTILPIYAPDGCAGRLQGFSPPWSPAARAWATAGRRPAASSAATAPGSAAACRGGGLAVLLAVAFPVLLR